MASQPSIPHEPPDVTLDLLDDAEQIRDAETKLLDQINAQGFPEASVFAVRLAFEEAVLNGLRHGHKDLPGTPVRVSWRVLPECVTIRVEDKGPGFDPADLPDPTAPERLEKPCGRGVMLIHAYMTRVSYNDSGNVVTMQYDKPTDG